MYFFFLVITTSVVIIIWKGRVPDVVEAFLCRDTEVIAIETAREDDSLM